MLRFFTWFFPLSIILGVILVAVLCNTVCRNKDSKSNEATKDSLKNNKLIIVVLVMSVILIGINIMVLMFSGNISITASNDKINVDAYNWKGISIPYTDISSIEYKKDINVGSKTSGFNNGKLKEGCYKNSTFGNYTLYTYNNCNEFIVIHTNTEIIMLNQKNPQSTKDLYELISQKSGNAK